MHSAGLGNEFKMFFPELLARMKEPNRVARFLVGACYMIGFTDVARSARQGEIRVVVGTCREPGRMCSTSKGKLKIASGAWQYSQR
jgi:hypothetical protein